MSTLQGFLNATPEKPHYEDVAEAEYEALRKDAERYRWMRAHPIMLDGFSYCVDDEVEAFVDASMAAAPAVGAA